MKISFVYFRIIFENSIMAQTMLEILAENVKYYRSKTGLSQFKFAIQLEISPSYLNDIESGRQYASLKMLERLAKEFNIAPYQLLLPKDISKEDAISAQYKDELRSLKEQVVCLFDEQLEK